MQNSSKEEENSENKSGYNYKNTNEKGEGENIHSAGKRHNSKLPKILIIKILLF